MVPPVQWPIIVTTPSCSFLTRASAPECGYHLPHSLVPPDEIGGVHCRGLTTDEAMSLTDDDLLEEQGGLPDENLHCARFAAGTLYDAIKHVRGRKGPTSWAS